MSSLFAADKSLREMSNESTTEERQKLLMSDDAPQYSGIVRIVVDDPTTDQQVAEIIYALFMKTHPRSHEHPRTSPRLPPEIRGKRHRLYTIYMLNQFVRKKKRAIELSVLSFLFHFPIHSLSYTTLLWFLFKIEALVENVAIARPARWNDCVVPRIVATHGRMGCRKETANEASCSNGETIGSRRTYQTILGGCASLYSDIAIGARDGSGVGSTGRQSIV